ncbi:MAG: ABC transporter ATP-binding protein [Lachnospiraceae bacterium]|nr:ABC transporter ATP-binding protein [Lachnospiraceae bacterium]
MDNILRIEHIEKFYGSRGNVVKALDDISFKVAEGEFSGIMGPSGSGKTTLLNCISTIDMVSAGNIYIGGKNITELKEKEMARFRRENLGFIFQDYSLLETLSIKENIELMLSVNQVSVDEAEEKILKIAEELGISGILEKFPNEVSGGESQRCACARAMVNKPKIVLADEPTGALDSHSSKLLLQLFEKMNERRNVTILMVTHDAFTASYAKRILFLKDGRVFTEIRRGSKNRKEFFNEILDVMAVLGGDLSDVR